jgi:hypothetical protein
MSEPTVLWGRLPRRPRQPASAMSAEAPPHATHSVLKCNCRGGACAPEASDMGSLCVP